MAGLKISIILPFPVTKPVGGAKIMYEYANRLYAKGHQVSVYHSIKRPFKNSKTPVRIKQLIFFFRGVARPDWFPLHKKIKSVIVPEIKNRYLPDADIVLSTWWQMAYAVNDLSPAKGKKFNLIQDYENWDGQQAAVDNSFNLPLNHMVISRYLQKLVEEKSGSKPFHLPNAIDTDKFFNRKALSARDPYTLIMLCSSEPRKGSQTGLKVLETVQQKLPQLRAILFGVDPAPKDMPARVTYHQKPAALCDLYNSAAVFFSPSIAEGWALPPAEAMACGCAVVCTDIGGHADYATDGETALLVEPGNINDMAEKIIAVMENNTLRNKLSANGQQLINTEFSWARSIKKLETCFCNSSEIN